MKRLAGQKVSAINFHGQDKLADQNNGVRRISKVNLRWKTHKNMV
jgi:hypothetical protein